MIKFNLKLLYCYSNKVTQFLLYFQISRKKRKLMEKYYFENRKKKNLNKVIMSLYWFIIAKINLINFIKSKMKNK